MPFRPSFPSLSSPSSSSSSRQWLSRQSKDPFVRQRITDPAAYRSRSAYKLLQLEESFGFLSKPDVRVVVDLGAAPGGWSQVVAKKLGWGDVRPLAASGVVRGKGKGKMIGKGTGGGLDMLSMKATKQRVKLGFGKLGEKRMKKHGSWSGLVEEDQEAQEEEQEREHGQEDSEVEEKYDPLGNSEDEERAMAGRGRGIVISVDLLSILPIRGAYTLRADFLAPETEELVEAMVIDAHARTGGNNNTEHNRYANIEGKVDVILSDMAANSSGNSTHDIESSLEISKAVFEFTKKHLRSADSSGRKYGGVLLLKHFTHPFLQRFRSEYLHPNFNDVKFIKPDSSRSSSSEGYWLCQGWKGPEY